MNMIPRRPRETSILPVTIQARIALWYTRRKIRYEMQNAKLMNSTIALFPEYSRFENFVVA